MKLEGIHHITAITGDAPRNVDFYVRVLGLRMVKKSVNQDDPTVYHLFYADENGSAGSDLTFFEYPNARAGRAGAGMVHRDRPSRRVGRHARLLGRPARRRGRLDVAGGRWAAVRRPGGARARVPRRRRAGRAVDRPLDRGPGRARAAGLPRGPRLGRRSAQDREAARRGVELRVARRARVGGARRSRAAARSSSSRRPAAASAAPGTIHHIAWATPYDEHDAWRERVVDGGVQPTPVIDRFYFKSIYFREPGGDPLRTRHARARLRHRRARRDAGREARAAAGLRAAARAGRAAAHAAAGRPPMAAGTDALLTR